MSLNQSRLEYIDAAVGIIIIFYKPEHVRVEEIDFPEWRKWIIDDLQSCRLRERGIHRVRKLNEIEIGNYISISLRSLSSRVIVLWHWIG